MWVLQEQVGIHRVKFPELWEGGRRPLGDWSSIPLCYLQHKTFILNVLLKAKQF